MSKRTVGIIMNGVTGRMGTNQHLVRSILAIRRQGGGILLDMLCHWRHVLDNLFGPVKAVSCLGATHIGRRVDASGREYPRTAEDAAYATFLCQGPEGEIVCHFNPSWVVQVRRDDLAVFQVEGTKGSAVAGMRSWQERRWVDLEPLA
jgi:predicted dehydrogenase